jgi:phosphatidylglycerophosphate synthase
MLDRYALPLITPPLYRLARRLDAIGIGSDQITISGFILGLLALPALAFEQYAIALLLITLNRVADGLDGIVARLRQATDAGAYLDIVLDFIFYASIVCGFAWANPAQNALPAATLLFAFMGTGSSFLAFAIMAERRQIQRLNYPSKGFYYLDGLTEGTETIAIFIAFCVFPAQFPLLAYGFAGLCFITTATRVFGGYYTLKQQATP